MWLLVIYEFFKEKAEEGAKLEDAWHETFKKWSAAHPELAKEFHKMLHHELPADLEQKLAAIEMKSPLASRTSSQVVLDVLGPLLPQLYGGSADLSGSDMTMMKKFPLIAPRRFEGRNIKYGVREFAMAAAATGLAETQMITPYVGTFLTFSDYMRNAIRLAALSHIHVIYQFTHDSIFLGEDGPTHQPIEQFGSATGDSSSSCDPSCR